jgi:Mn-dependent DtxR family transcriptional regulator
MIQKLDGMGLVIYERYRGLTLTEKGEKIAKFTKQKHALILQFLRLLGTKEKTAKEDAEGIEHHVHKETLSRIEHFIEFVNHNPFWFTTFKMTYN